MDTVKFESGKIKMIAHRGLSGIERENTSAAFIAAANRSYFGIETDVHFTKDLNFVVIHDATTDRVSNGTISVNVEESNLSELSDIILPDKDGSTYRTDLRIPKLTEYIHICRKYEKHCILEVKDPFSDEAISKMIDEIKETGYIDNVIFISFDFNNCLKIRKLLPNSTIQLLIGNKEVTEEIIQSLVENRFDLALYYKRATRELVDKLHSNNLKINVWTCDDKADAMQLIDMGVDFITSNILE